MACILYQYTRHDVRSIPTDLAGCVKLSLFELYKDKLAKILGTHSNFGSVRSGLFTFGVLCRRCRRNIQTSGWLAFTNSWHGNTQDVFALHSCFPHASASCTRDLHDLGTTELPSSQDSMSSMGWNEVTQRCPEIIRTLLFRVWIKVMRAQGWPRAPQFLACQPMVCGCSRPPIRIKQG